MYCFVRNLCRFLATEERKDYNKTKIVSEENDMYVMAVFDIVIIGFGIYMIAAGLKMKKTGEISSMMLAEEEMKKCKDKAGFISYIYWKEAVFGAVMIGAGMLGLVNELVVSLGKFSYVELVVFLAVFLWFSRELGIARGKYLSKF